MTFVTLLVYEFLELPFLKGLLTRIHSNLKKYQEIWSHLSQKQYFCRLSGGSSQKQDFCSKNRTSRSARQPDIIYLHF